MMMIEIDKPTNEGRGTERAKKRTRNSGRKNGENSAEEGRNAENGRGKKEESTSK